MDPIRKKQEALQDLNDAEERWMRKLIRAANALSDIRAKKKRLLKPRKLAASEAITSKDYHLIRDDFDDSEVLATLGGDR
jgi:hypothetical protein